ncbi:MAG: nucleotidyltransferase domain-containing protein [Thermoguttaceae bacterium]|nr:nucleotidyltransferase domain-containing protein [Thermoguttaceae bacterium]MBR4751226.1 nucleotidyltransferase domain-containing protein [Thermoguttaceae bacterium]MBR5758036.1 nucleotidyltransferase domain-containing protein [Thermoguttaceae bacterium]
MEKEITVPRIEHSTLDELVAGVLESVGDSVNSIVLYGSVARGDAEDDSDVDVALIVNKPLTRDDDERLNDFFVDMDLKYGKFFSVVNILESKFQEWREYIPFYRNIVKEGIVLWKAA